MFSCTWIVGIYTYLTVSTGLIVGNNPSEHTQAGTSSKNPGDHWLSHVETTQLNTGVSVLSLKFM